MTDGITVTCGRWPPAVLLLACNHPSFTGASMLATLLTALLAGSAPAPDCHIGAYRLSDGSAVDVAPTDGDALRWRRIDGSTGKLSRGADDTWTSTFGWTDRPDGKTVRFTDCAKGKLSFGDM